MSKLTKAQTEILAGLRDGTPVQVHKESDVRSLIEDGYVRRANQSPGPAKGSVAVNLTMRGRGALTKVPVEAEPVVAEGHGG